jgi:hypothetical protein
VPVFRWVPHYYSDFRPALYFAKTAPRRTSLSLSGYEDRNP